MAVDKQNAVAHRLARVLDDARQRYRCFRQRPLIWILLMPALPFHYYFMFLLNTEYAALEVLSQGSSDAASLGSKRTGVVMSLLIKARRWQFFVSGWDIADEKFAHSVERYYRFVLAFLIVLMVAIEAFVSILVWALLIQWVGTQISVARIQVGGS